MIDWALFFNGLNLGLLVVAFMLGRLAQRWADDDVWRWEEEIFEEGRGEGYREGYRDAKLGLPRRL